MSDLGFSRGKDIDDFLKDSQVVLNEYVAHTANLPDPLVVIESVLPEPSEPLPLRSAVPVFDDMQKIRRWYAGFPVSESFQSDYEISTKPLLPVRTIYSLGNLAADSFDRITRKLLPR